MDKVVYIENTRDLKHRVTCSHCKQTYLRFVMNVFTSERKEPEKCPYCKGRVYFDD